MQNPFYYIIGSGCDDIIYGRPAPGQGISLQNRNSLLSTGINLTLRTVQEGGIVTKHLIFL